MNRTMTKGNQAWRFDYFLKNKTLRVSRFVTLNCWIYRVQLKSFAIPFALNYTITNTFYFQLVYKSCKKKEHAIATKRHIHYFHSSCIRCFERWKFSTPCQKYRLHTHYDFLVGTSYNTRHLKYLTNERVSAWTYIRHAMYNEGTGRHARS